MTDVSFLDQLIADCQAAKTTKPTKQFELTSLEQVKGIKNGIYIIEELGGNPQATFDDMKAYKATKQRALPKPNKPSGTLYVGSSTTGIQIRLRQHLTENDNAGTYALHLPYWFKGKMKVTVMAYDDTISRSVIQLLEDNLSHQLQPAFGKKGGNNK